MTSLPIHTAHTFLTAAWRWLVVLNYQIEPQLLAPYLPRGTALDFDRDGKTYVSLVGFRFENTRLRGWRIPGHCHFEELNLRFYVQRQAGSEVRRGVVFIKELVPRVAISTVARWAYNENYFTVPMRHSILSNQRRIGCGESVAPDAGFEATYEFYHGRAWHKIQAECAPHSFLPHADAHEAFILEHYWGYCRQRDGGTIEYRVEHPRWNVWPATRVVAQANFAQLYGETFAPVLACAPASAFVADGSWVSVARPQRLPEGGYNSQASVRRSSR